MRSNIYQIVYQSRATAPLDDAAAARLGRVAYDFNSALGVTGLLLYDGARFIQALEGDEAAVAEIMKRIERDTRHDSLTYVQRGMVDARQFGDWAMDFRRVDDVAGARAFIEGVKRAMTSVQDTRLIAAFIGFAVLGRPDVRHSRLHMPSLANNAAAGHA